MRGRALLAILRRLWRAAVLVVAALCFLLALFLDYDGLGQALGLGALMTGTAGRIALAGVAAIGVGLATARFGAARAPARKTRKSGGTARKRNPAKTSGRKAAP